VMLQGIAGVPLEWPGMCNAKYEGGVYAGVQHASY
jgi:hypothetical protein